MHGKCFRTPVPGADIDNRSDRDSLNAWPKVAWTMTDFDAPQNERWQSRHALDGCKECPVISPFIPIVNFDIYRHVRVNAETAKGCLQRLEENNVMIPEFVRDGLDDPSGNG